MKANQIITGLLLVALLAACNDNAENRGNSTTIDSTNLRGTAPATYGPSDPAAAEPPRYEGRYDTGMQPNTMNHQDSLEKFRREGPANSNTR